MILAVLGDSIAYGQGAARRADTVGERLAAALTAAGTPTEVLVFAIPGARSDSLAGQVRRALAQAPDVALVIVGANDLTHFVAPHQAASQLGAAVRDLRTAGVEVVVAPAPDLSVVPWVPPQFHALVRAGSGALAQAQARIALAEGARVADISAIARFRDDVAMFSGDRFHPSSAGYALIAQTLGPAITAAAAAALDRTG